MVVLRRKHWENEANGSRLVVRLLLEEGMIRNHQQGQKKWRRGSMLLVYLGD